MKIRLVAAAVVMLSLSLACDLGKTTSQATARHVMVATLIETPVFELKPEAIAGLDASVPMLPDGGTISLDGGLLVPRQTAAAVFFGQRVGDDLTQAPTGVANATVTVMPAGGAALTLKDQGQGAHGLTSQDDATLQYQQGATYTFSATAEGLTYVADVENSPPVERITQFHPAVGYIDLAAGAAFTFVRPDPAAGAERNLGFVNVFPISRDGSKGEVTYSNIPQTPLEFLKLVAAPGDWKKTTIVVPGSAFPNADANYVISLQSAKLGGAKSDNLFIGSAVISGTADVGVVKTRK